MRVKIKTPRSLYKHFHSGKWARKIKERREMSAKIQRLLVWAREVGPKIGVETNF
jgi:hypothetical protein